MDNYRIGTGDKYFMLRAYLFGMFQAYKIMDCEEYHEPTLDEIYESINDFIRLMEDDNK